MGQSAGSGNSKLADLKVAASDLVKIVVWDNQSSYKSRVALVPFSADVRIPGNWLSAVQNPAWGTTPGKGNGNAFGLNKTHHKTACVAERAGVENYSDAAAGPGQYIMNAYTKSGKCSQNSSNSEVTPMTNDKAKLLSSIEKLELGGGTAGHVGTAWAYYMLSPKWAPIVPTESAAANYGDPKTKKIAILMTDGEYNFTYDADGVPTNDSGGNANGATSAAQAISVCQQMKQNGITVYTIGFDLGGNQTAVNTLKTCATDPAKFYNAVDGSQLKTAFRDIALKVSELYLSR
jgi:hypothetical protein